MILLVRPKPHSDSVGLQSFMISEPLELETVATALQNEGHSVIIADMILEKRTLLQILEEVQPTLVGFTSYLTHVNVVRELATLVKHRNSEIITVVGGIHAEVVPTDFEDCDLDFILHAHGLPAMVEIANHPEASLETLRTEVPGIWDGPSKKYPETPYLPKVYQQSVVLPVFV